MTSNKNYVQLQSPPHPRMALGGFTQKQRLAMAA
jgi:hypothetical protein